MSAAMRSRFSPTVAGPDASQDADSTGSGWATTRASRRRSVRRQVSAVLRHTR